MRYLTFALALVAFAGPAPGLAQSAARDGILFSGMLGWESVGGDLGRVLDQGITAEFGAFYGFDDWRAGLGVNIVSYSYGDDVELPPDVEDPSQTAHRVTANAQLAWFIPVSWAARPYIEGRLGYARFKAESADFFEEPPEEEGEYPTPRYNAFSATLRAGVEIPVLRKWNLDVSAVFGGLSTEEVDLTPVNLGTASGASTWGVLVGTTFYP